jgi:hypothetical protein
VKLRFFNPDVDVLLLELTAAIPSSFKPFQLGWDASSDAPPAAAVGIHYPHGAPRSISYTQCAGGPRAIGYIYIFLDMNEKRVFCLALS